MSDTEKIVLICGVFALVLLTKSKQETVTVIPSHEPLQNQALADWIDNLRSS